MKTINHQQLWWWIWYRQRFKWWRCLCWLWLWWLIFNKKCQLFAPTILLAMAQQPAITSSTIIINSSKIFDEIKQNPSQLCIINENYWQLIISYFNRVSYIGVTEITTNQGRNSSFADLVIKRLVKEKKFTFFNYAVDLNYMDESGGISDAYGRYGKKFPTRVELRENPPSILDINFNRSLRHFTDVNVNRNKPFAFKYQPKFGRIVFTTSLQTLARYLVGPPRRPFHSPSGHFVIVINAAYDNDDDDDRDNPREIFDKQLAGHILYTLWRDYRIPHAFIMDSCLNEEIIGFYDPFTPDPEKLSTINADEPLLQDYWGSVKWAKLSKINISGDWIINSLTNLYGYPYHSAIFPRYPTILEANELPQAFLNSYFASAIKHTGGWVGFDALVLGNLAIALNFFAKIIIGKSYGERLNNDTFTDTMGAVLYQNADCSFNTRFITYYNTDEIDFHFPVFADKFCIIVPGALPYPGWSAIFRCFTGMVWCIIFILESICAYSWLLLKKTAQWHPKNNHNNQSRYLSYGIVEATMTIFGMLISAPIKMPIRLIERLFIATCLVSNIIFVGIFQGSLTRAFSTTVYEKDIDTLAELDHTGLPIKTSASTIKTMFVENESDPHMLSLKSKTISTKTSSRETIDNAAYRRTECGVERLSDVNILIRSFYQQPDGHDLVHVVKECLRDFHLTYIVKKGSPYMSSFDQTLRRFFEAGLLFTWYNQIERGLIAMREKDQPKSSKGNVFAFSLRDMQIAFIILAIGLLISIIIFLIEMLFFR